MLREPESLRVTEQRVSDLGQSLIGFPFLGITVV